MRFLGHANLDLGAQIEFLRILRQYPGYRPCALHYCDTVYHTQVGARKGFRVGPIAINQAAAIHHCPMKKRPEKEVTKKPDFVAFLV